MPDELEYPTVDDILAIHEDIVSEDTGSEPGVRAEGSIHAALAYVSIGYFGRAPGTVHEKAVHLMRLLVSEHPFVDGNKRTALNAVSVSYEINGYEFDYEDAAIRTILNRFATDAERVDIDFVVSYFMDRTEPTED